MKRIICIVIMVTASCWFVGEDAGGAEFCVSDAVGLQSALTTAAANTEADTIKVVQGTYLGHFSYNSSKGYGITLQGGYTVGCASRVLDPANTVLDGSGTTGRVLYLYNSSGGDISVEGVTIRNGNLAADGGGIYAHSESASGTAGNVTLATNTVTGNSATGSGAGGGIHARSESDSGTAGNITLLNNIVTGNTSGTFGGGAFTYSISNSGAAGTITLINNIVAWNTAADQGGGGVYVC